MPLASASLYDEIHKHVEAETTAKRVEPEVAAYVATFFEDQWKTDTADIEAVARGDRSALCGEKPGRREALNQGTCLTLFKGIQEVLAEETRVRGLGRDLLGLIVGMELSTSDIEGQALRSSVDTDAILNIWQAGAAGAGTAGGTIRTRTVDEGTVQPILEQLHRALQALSPEERIAAVERYRHGVRLVQGQRAPTFPASIADPESGPGTERQYEFKRWGDIEETLLVLWGIAETEIPAYMPPLGGDIALLHFPTTLLQRTMPPNVIVWGQVDDLGPTHPFGDIGLAWELPQDVLAPSLLPDHGAPAATQGRVILGGRYPPVFAAGQLCTHAPARRGYLCRPVEDGPRCPVPPGARADAITLVTCATGTADATIAGPDVCREIDWRENGFDPETQCTVEVVCERACLPGIPTSAVTRAKKNDGMGTIEICVNNSPAGVAGPATYVIYHELIHAYQKCSLPPGTNLFDGLTEEEKATACCSVEGEAYRTECERMERDGLFRGTDGVQRASTTGIPFDAESCTEAWTNFACGPQQGFKGCRFSRAYPATFLKELIDVMEEAEARNPGNVPVTCDAWKAQGDPGTDLLLRTIERKRPVCAPGTITTYRNRIGNDLCLIGQCAEEILELSEINGRTPALAGESGSPWSPASPRVLPGDIERATPVKATALPGYNPGLLVQEFDASVCKLVGLPTRSPLIQCIADAQRRLDLPLQSDAQTMTEFLRQAGLQEQLSLSVESLAASYARERGMLLFVDEVRRSQEGLAGSLAFVVDALTRIRTIAFPTLMCLLDGTPATPPPAP